mmetsp:Transcript_6708/g.16128  ORF Transcript_6708/g.16128 Transcript_6708/m.16128 type:complete len:251 (-) Transcript_6708:1282-2034(-)
MPHQPVPLLVPLSEARREDAVVPDRPQEPREHLHKAAHAVALHLDRAARRVCRRRVHVLRIKEDTSSLGARALVAPPDARRARGVFAPREHPPQQRRRARLILGEAHDVAVHVHHRHPRRCLKEAQVLAGKLHLLPRLPPMHHQGAVPAKAHEAARLDEMLRPQLVRRLHLLVDRCAWREDAAGPAPRPHLSDLPHWNRVALSVGRDPDDSVHFGRRLSAAVRAPVLDDTDDDPLHPQDEHPIPVVGRLH